MATNLFVLLDLPLLTSHLEVHLFSQSEHPLEFMSSTLTGLTTLKELAPGLVVDGIIVGNRLKFAAKLVKKGQR